MRGTGRRCGHAGAFPFVWCCVLVTIALPSSALQHGPGLRAMYEPPPIPSHLRLPPRPAGAAPPPLHNQGLVRVAYSDPNTSLYLSSPAILRLDADTLLVSHDFFPEQAQGGMPPRTAVYASTDGGASWRLRAEVWYQYCSSLFLHRGALYLLGIDDGAGSNMVSIARSMDGGVTWERNSLLRPPPSCSFGTGSVPVVLEGGRLWHGMEYICGPGYRWPQDYRAFLISASAAADLLDPAAWHATRAVQFNRSLVPAWMPEPVESGGFLEGNAVRLPNGGVGLLLRCRVYDGRGRMYGVQQACLYRLRPQPSPRRPPRPPVLQQATAGVLRPGLTTPRGMQARVLQQAGQEEQQQELQRHVPAQEPATGPDLVWQGFIEMPGGGNKFVVRYDAVSRRYLALTNPSIDRYGSNPDARNVLVLAHSLNLIDWRVATTVLVPNDGLSWEQSLWYTGYQYADWTVDGEDLLAAIRTAYDGANSFHNSNQVTFKRVQRFRQYLPRPPGPGADP